MTARRGALHVEILVTCFSYLYLFYFAAICCRTPMRPEAVEDTAVPRHPVRFKHHLVLRPSRQAPEIHAFIRRQTSGVV